MAGLFGAWGDKPWYDVALDAINMPDVAVQTALGKLVGDKNAPSFGELARGEKSYGFSQIKKALENNYGLDLTVGDKPEDSMWNTAIDFAGDLATSPIDRRNTWGYRCLSI